ncbi:Uma2 family endonuclease [Roseiarcus fermentans]|uniref:Uma2 family endonuclease n=2 Tax=Roseiarcus fermentans TaxID=1473586 RepID=A0A366FQ33_9HYPH|nr:Uma2 family endonuclease [Roseiarcus fermentans]
MSVLPQTPQAPARHRLDVGAYYRMAEAGILAPFQRVELIDGEIFDMNPIGSPHAAVTRRLEQGFARAVADGLLLTSVRNPLRLDPFTEPQPDFVVLPPRADAFAASHPGPDDALLVVEVADSSLAYDRETKLPLYAKFGIVEVWIVDLAARVVEVYRDPAEGRYGSAARMSEGLLTPSRIPAISIDVAALFG